MKLLVMLIWIGGYHGGGATVQGFQSLDACEAARPVVTAEFYKMQATFNDPKTVCVELRAAP